MKYSVNISEVWTPCVQVEIEASTWKEARDIAKANYKAGLYDEPLKIDDSSCFDGPMIEVFE